MTVSHYSASELKLFLRGVPLFSGIPEEWRDELAAAATVHRVGAGEWLFREGDSGDDLFVVLSGIIAVVREHSPGAEVIQYMAKGDFVGELSLITEMSRSASVRAIRDAELLRVRRTDFRSLLERNPAFAITLTRILGMRLHKTAISPTAPTRSNRVITIVAFSASDEISRAVRSLCEHLSRQPRTAFLTERPATAKGLNPEEVAVDCGRVLSEAESSSDVVVLRCDRNIMDEEWRRFCLRQADRVIVLVDNHTVVSQPDFPVYSGCDLVFVGDDHGIETIRFWTERFHPRTHHRIRGGSHFAKDIGRTARRISGRSIGLVLSGGAARGVAHIGVIEALEDAGIVIDRIGGSSMGALVAAMYATGRSLHEIMVLSRDLLPELFSGFTPSVVSIFNGEGAWEMLHAMVGKGTIEELALPFFACSSDLVQAETVVHREGPIAEAVAASAAIPVILPPVRSGDRILVDGCILNNLPSDVMAAENEGPVIASDVVFSKSEFADRLTKRIESKKTRFLSRAMARLMGGRRELPELWVTATRSALLNSVQDLDRKREIADLAIVCDCTEWGLFQFDRAEEIVNVGRRAARVAMKNAEWLKKFTG